MTPIARSTTLVSLLLAAAGCGARGDVPPPQAAPAKATAVRTETVSEQPMPRFLSVTGTLVANQRADVAANAGGRVVRTYVERGDFVRAGAPLVQLEAEAAALGQVEAGGNMEAARAQEELAVLSCARSEELFEKGAISREEWDRVRAGCRTSSGAAVAATARAHLARKSLRDATVRAPFSGVVDDRLVSVGEYVQPASEVVSLVELTPLRLRMTVPEVDVGRIAPGQEVSFQVPAHPGETFTATVRYIGPALRSATRDLVVEASVANPERRLRPGMFATARLKLPDEPLAAVPRSALLREERRARLFAVVDGRLEERVVQPGTERDGYVAILEGARAGERVVVEPSDSLKDGAVVD